MALFRGKGREEAAGSGPSADALARVLELVQRVGAEEHPEDVLDAAVDAAVDLTEAERGFIVLERPDEGLDVRAARARGGVPLEDAFAKISRTVIERALSEDTPLCVDEAREEAGLSGAPSVAEMRLRAVLCVPFRLQDARGVFYLDNRFASGVFDQQSLDLLASFCGPVAMILRHSDLERRLVRTAEALSQANRGLDQRLRDRNVEIRRLRGLAAREQGAEERTDPFPELLGESPAMREAIDGLQRAAEADFPVLLRGESGTGKDLFAHALHRASSRGQDPFVALGAAGLDGPLLEAELFGVRKGAFTGALEDRPGLFEAAGTGVLYLDGIDSLPLELQPKLLRVLEDGSFRPVGGGAPRQCAARLICASRADLAERVRAERFREDLYYRVKVFEITLPPLRERRGDLPLLLEHFLQAGEARAGIEVARPDENQMERLRRHTWPGNVRELASFATRWIAFDGEFQEAQWSELLDEEPDASAHTLQELSVQLLLRTLEETGGNKAEAARRLGISRRTLYNRLKGLQAG